MRLWQEYIEEREGAQVIYNDNAFVTYKRMNDEEILVVDLFVTKSQRKSGVVHALWDELLEKTKPKKVYGLTDTNALNWKQSNAFMVSFNFIPYAEENSTIYYYREIL